jgi:hypothetical protein
MKLTVLTADSAQVDSAGKVHALGLGWVQTTTPTPPMSLVLFLNFDEPQSSSEPISLTVKCLDANGRLAKIESGKELEFKGALNGESGAVRAIAAINLAPGINLEPGAYRWVASIDGTEIEEVVPFEAVSAPS